MHPLTCAPSKPSTHASHAAPTLPGRVHTRSLSTRDHLHPTFAPARPQSCCPHVLGEGWRLPGSQETKFGSTSTCSLRSSQWYHARLVPLLAWHPAREPDVENQVPPPDVKPPFALIAAQPRPPATPLHAPRSAHVPVHRIPRPPCPAGTTATPRARANTCAPSLTVGAHALGPDRRVPGFEETTFGAISTCITASSQRYHA